MAASNIAEWRWLAPVLTPSVVLLWVVHAAGVQPSSPASGSQAMGLTCSISIAKGLSMGRPVAAMVTVENVSRIDITGKMHGEFVLTSASQDTTQFEAYVHPLTGTRIEPYITRLMESPGGPATVPFMPYVNKAPFHLPKGRRSVVRINMADAPWYRRAHQISFATIPAGSYTLSFRIVGLSGNGRDAVSSNNVDVLLP